MNERKTFVFHSEWKEAIKGFPAPLKIELYEAIVDYAMGNEVNLSPTAVLIFEFIKVKMDADINKYNAVTERNRENGAKGGRKPKETQRNPKKPVGYSETQKTQPNPKNPTEPKKPNRTQKNHDNDYDIELLSNSNELSNNKEEKKNIIYNILKKEENQTDFDRHFKTLADPICVGNEFQSFREIASKRFGVENWEQAIKCFKEHIQYHGKESEVLGMNNSIKLREYLSKALPYIKLSDEAKVKPKQEHYDFAEIQDPERWRKPCVRLANREVEAYGKKILVGVVIQDGKEWYTPPELPAPQTRFHYYNLDTEQYDDTSQHRPECSGQSVDYPPMAWIHSRATDYYLRKNRDKLEDKQSDF